MAETGSWNGHVFTVSPNLIRGFDGLSIKGASETTAKTSGKQQYFARKSGKPVEATITVKLNAQTGCDVKTEALQFVSEARDGANNYFYVGSTKLVPCKLMLVEANVEETKIAPNGSWVSANVTLAFRQCSKNDGSAASGKKSGGSNGKKKKSKKTSVRKTKKKTVGVSVDWRPLKEVSKLEKAVNYVKRTVIAAKKASKAASSQVTHRGLQE
jgi:hypothetical protein